MRSSLYPLRSSLYPLRSSLYPLRSSLYGQSKNCLLYTSDAADDTPCVDLGGRRIIKGKKSSGPAPAQLAWLSIILALPI